MGLVCMSGKGGTTCAMVCMYTHQWTNLGVALYLIPCLRKASCSLLHTPGGLAQELWGLSCPHSFSNHRSARMTSMSYLIQFVMLILGMQIQGLCFPHRTISLAQLCFFFFFIKKESSFEEVCYDLNPKLSPKGLVAG